jgi:hypothetical protein
MMKNTLLAFLIVGLFTGCLKGNDDNNNFTCSYNDCAVVAPATEIDAVQAYLSLTVSQLPDIAAVFFMY